MTASPFGALLQEDLLYLHIWGNGAEPFFNGTHHSFNQSALAVRIDLGFKLGWEPWLFTVDTGSYFWLPDLESFPVIEIRQFPTWVPICFIPRTPRSISKDLCVPRHLVIGTFLLPSDRTTWSLGVKWCHLSSPTSGSHAFHWNQGAHIDGDIPYSWTYHSERATAELLRIYVLPSQMYFSMP